MSPHGPGFSGALHSHDPEFPDDEWNLYSMVDKDGLKALNATQEEMVKGIFRPFVHRLDPAPVLESNADEELIIIVPFTSPCSIRKLMIVGGGRDEQHPLTVKCYVNNVNVSFDNVADMKPAQTFTNLSINNDGTHELMTTLRQFSNVNSVVLYICANHGAELTTLRYIGMQGEHTHYRREAVDAEYEVLCNGQDIQQPDDFKAKDNVGM